MITTVPQHRRRKPRLQDLATEAGVGTATVERVVNARGNVSSETTRRVILAAKRLGFDRPFPTPHHALVRVEVILVRPDSEFFSRLNVEFKLLAQRVDPLMVVHRSFVDENAPTSMARRIREIARKRAGLIVVAQDHPEIAEAVHWASASGVPVVLLVSELQADESIPYIGIDNMSAGRTAGFFMKTILLDKPGRVLTVCHSGSYANHRRRIQGFGDYFSNADKTPVFSYCIMGNDLDEMTEHALKAALSKFDDVIGIYNAGGAHKGVENALRSRKKLGKIAYIGHELSPESRKLLQADNMVLTIDQVPELQAQRAINLLERLIGLRSGDADYSPVPFRVVTKENLSR
jgi:LacI family transcriptional regulator